MDWKLHSIISLTSQKNAGSRIAPTAVRQAVPCFRLLIDKDSWENYLKIQREKTWFESTLEERKNKERELGKIIKNYKKDMKKNRH